MAKKKEAKKAEPEVIEITEEEIVADDGGRNWSEDIEMAGDEVKGFLKNLWTEGNVRRVVVRNEAGETVMNLPVAVGALGLFPPLTTAVIGVAAVGTAVALLSKCKITIERHAPEENGEVA